MLQDQAESGCMFDKREIRLRDYIEIYISQCSRNSAKEVLKMTEKASITSKNAFLSFTCTEDMFEGFMRERLCSPDDDISDADMENEDSAGNDVSEVVSLEEDTSADSVLEINNSVKQSSNHVQNDLNSNSHVNKNKEQSAKPSESITSSSVDHYYFNIRRYGNEKSRGIDELRKTTTNSSKNVALFKPIAPKMNSKFSSGIHPNKSTVSNTTKAEESSASKKDTQVFLANGNDKLDLSSQKKLLSNDNKFEKNIQISNHQQAQKISIASAFKEVDSPQSSQVDQRKAILLSKTKHGINGLVKVVDVNRKAVDSSGVSLLSKVFNGNIVKKINLDNVPKLMSKKHAELETKEAEKVIDQNGKLSPSSTRTFLISHPGQSFQTVSIKKPVSVSDSARATFLALMKKPADNESISLLSNSGIRFKPISKHSVQCVIDKHVPFNERRVQAIVDNMDKPILKNSPDLSVEHKNQRTLQNNNKNLDSLSAKSLSSRTPHQSTENTDVSNKSIESTTSTPEVIAASSATYDSSALLTENDLKVSFIHQLNNRTVPPYKPPQPSASSLHACANCNDKFTQISSLDFHRGRRSILIVYWCPGCNCRLNFFNRCSFLGHLRLHNLNLNTLDTSNLTVEPIPQSLVVLGNKLQNDTNQSSTIVCNESLNCANVKSIAVGTHDGTNPDSCLVSEEPSVITPVHNDLSIDATDSSTRVHMQSSKPSTDLIDISEDLLNEDIEEEETFVDNEPTIEIKRSNEFNLEQKNSVKNKPENSEKPVSPLISDDSIGGVDAKASKLNQMKGPRICPECRLSLPSKLSLRKHLLSEGRPTNMSFQCNDCKLILPTRCSLSMHLRIHIPLKPYRCPDCAVEFRLFARFMIHLKDSCCHLAKVVRFSCSLCSYLHRSLAGLKDHVINKHTRRIIKCTKCPVAFLNMKMIERHQHREHPGKKVESSVYAQCRFCPDKLIPLKKFGTHIGKHMSEETFWDYAFECSKCKTCFLEKTDLISHRSKCEKGETPSIVTIPVEDDEISDSNFVEVEASKSSVQVKAAQSSNAMEVDDEVEVIMPVRKRLRMDDDDDDVCEQDPLSLEGFRVEEQVAKEPKFELCVLCKKQQVVIQPGDDPALQSLCCRECVRPCDENDLQPRQTSMRTRRKTKTQTLHRCKLCNYITTIDFSVIVRHFKRTHRAVPESDINNFVTTEKKNVFHSIRSKTISAAESIKDKYLKKKKTTDGVDTIKVKEEIGECDDLQDEEGSAEEKSNKKKSFRSRPNSSVSGGCSFDSGLVMPSKPADQILRCSRCNFDAQQMTELRQHMTQHRSDTSALQCLDCGECFVVLPSFEKHLIIHHRISDVQTYIAEYPSCLPQDANSEDIHTCSVCHITFDTKSDLDKHFRIHGMAFLQKNRPIS